MAGADYREFLGGRVRLYAGDCVDVMRRLPENSVDLICCDPPYHLTSIVDRFGKAGAAEAKAGATGAFKRASAGFMGKEWDGGDVAFRVETWAAALRVLKPGGYLLAFASTRGFGRMSVAIEDAGFVTHPLTAFLTEHPDAQEFLSMLDSHQLAAFLRLCESKDLGGMLGWVFGSGFPKATRIKAEGYDGWRYGGQALKPAIEPIYMGQKPFEKGMTGTDNILKWGTGGLNIDGCRIEGGGDVKPRGSSKLDTNMNDGWARPWMEDRAEVQRRHDDAVARANQLGRWPANLIHDGSEDVVAAFPDAPGALRRVDESFAPKTGTAVYGDYGPRAVAEPRGDSGSSARFFYSAKADAEDRIGSKHPTVKPVDLMRYLVRLATPKNGVVLDPFAGTGTTGEAAYKEGFSAWLIEREDEYREDIAARMRLVLSGPTEKPVEIAKRRGGSQDAGPLFDLPQAVRVEP